MRTFQCSKCEAKEIAVFYKESGMVHTGFKSETYRKERLLCQCKRCGNKWKEKPSDSEEYKNENT